VCILIGVVPTCAAIAFRLFPDVRNEWIFGAGILVSFSVGLLVDRHVVKTSGGARCPACGVSWELLEEGPHADMLKVLESRRCPHCGVSW
jgi:hypothetical protein